MRRCSATILFAIAPLLAQTQQEWVGKSNQNAKILLDVIARYAPERSGSLGVIGLDEKISVATINQPELFRKDLGDTVQKLEVKSAAEPDPLVKQDLDILIAAAQKNIRASQAYEQHLLPYQNVARIVFFGIHSLLDDQIAPERRPSAVTRLRRYTGLEQGYPPATLLAEQRFLEKLQTPGLLGPPKTEVDQDLATTNQYVTGIGLLLEKYKMRDYQEPYSKLKEQLADYNDFVRTRVLPRARSDFRLPPELYAINLENVGVDYTTPDLIRLAHQTFSELQGQVQALATKLAKERNLPSSDYRQVIRVLKKDQLDKDQVLPLYKQRLEEIEGIIRREHLVTLPARPCIIHLASAAETAEQPSPRMVAPPLVNNHGEQGQFVLPAGTVDADGKPLKYDDFTFSAASWTLTAHEARPGHELQFAAMVEHGVSQARAIFAFNSTNVEGWALYSEWFMLPYMSDDGKLISLQLRLLRAARAFLDPELQQGKITPEQAKATLENDVVLSEAFATEEVDRFTFRMPGQSVAYFDGYTRLLQLRSDVEKKLGPKFNLQDFHDFILSQGLLPPSVLRKAVMAHFVGGA